MRPLEMLLLLANLIAYVVLALPAARAPHWTRSPAFTALPLAGVQALLEGPRWQMIPAYALSGLFFLAGLLRASQRRRLGRPATLLGTGLGALALVVAAALPATLPVFRFPRPSGPYAIGTLTYHWVDASRAEVFSANPQDHRELVAQIWYPAEQNQPAQRAPYLPDADALAPVLARLINLPGFILGHLKYISSNAISAAPVAGGEASYPVLIFLEGLGGYRQMNTFQVEELVSHGYVVAAIDQPYTASTVVFPDGRRVDYDDRMIPPYFQPTYDPRTDPPRSAFLEAHLPYLAQDVTFSLDQLTLLNRADPNAILTGRLDLERAGLFGHSLGGIIGGEACLLEPRLRACLLEDAFMPDDVVRAGLQQPTMWITRDADTMRLERRRAGGWPEAAIEDHLTTIRAVYESLPGDGYYVQVPGMFHLDMNDVPMLSPLAFQFGLSGPIGVERAHHIVKAYSIAFFDRHLKGRPAALLDGPAAEFPEVLIESSRS